MGQVEMGQPKVKRFGSGRYYISRQVDQDQHRYMRADGTWFWCMSVEGQIDGGTYFESEEEARAALDRAMGKSPAPTAPSLYAAIHSERIVAAAITIDGLTRSLPRPAGHGEVMALAVSIGQEMGREVQGFLTSRGRFVTRVEAMKIAHRAGQEFREARGGGQKPRSHQLFSEDLW